MSGRSRGTNRGPAGTRGWRRSTRNAPDLLLGDIRQFFRTLR
jgi:hypothetical protein